MSKAIQKARVINRTPSLRPFKKILHPRQRAFLKAYAISGVLTKAAKAAGVSFAAVVDWKKKTDFAVALEEARGMFCDLLENEAVTRAVKGVKRKKFYRGEPIIDPETGKQYEEHEKSDVLLIFAMKKHIPEYRDSNMGDGIGGGGGRVLSVSDAVRLVQASRGELGSEKEKEGKFVEATVVGEKVVKVKELPDAVDSR